MSTFDGYVKEFPTIRIDYFRSDASRPKPAACFLSHIHSDHLLGLETLRMSFVYCSATTKRLLLRMEKYPHRINFQKGILETRKQTWAHLRKILRPLPLQTPTVLELSPKLTIRVTLIDANHCPGAVMFLIEGNNKAVLYTGDVRAEPWWVNSIVQIPALLPYSCGMKRLDCIYLDTTFASHDDKYREFQTKAEGLRELMTKVGRIRAEGIARTGKAPKFYFRAWTLGYEQVWVALANMLQTKVHVDAYQLRLFDSTTSKDEAQAGYTTYESPSLVGFQAGNQRQEGCLSSDTSSQIHSCEPGMPCHTSLSKEGVIWITPIIARLRDGTELLELGAGGGGGDLYQTSELEVTPDLDLISAELISNPDALEIFRTALGNARKTGALTLSLEGIGLDNEAEVSLKEFAELISDRKEWTVRRTPAHPPQANNNKRGKVITFPFSRHSSLGELRHLVQNFRPKDLYACTVDLPAWSPDSSMQALFGDACSEKTFAHDAEVQEEFNRYQEQLEHARSLKRKRDPDSQDNASQVSQQAASFRSARSFPSNGKGPAEDGSVVARNDVNIVEDGNDAADDETQSVSEISDIDARAAAIRAEFERKMDGADLIVIDDDASDGNNEVNVHDSQASLTTSAFESQKAQVDGKMDIASETEDPETSPVRLKSSQARREAYEKARETLRRSDSGAWDDVNFRSIGGKRHSEAEVEL